MKGEPYEDAESDILKFDVDDVEPSFVFLILALVERSDER